MIRWTLADPKRKHQQLKQFTEDRGENKLRSRWNPKQCRGLSTNRSRDRTGLDTKFAIVLLPRGMLNHVAEAGRLNRSFIRCRLFRSLENVEVKEGTRGQRDRDTKGRENTGNKLHHTHTHIEVLSSLCTHVYTCSKKKTKGSSVNHLHSGLSSFWLPPLPNSVIILSFCVLLMAQIIIEKYRKRLGLSCCCAVTICSRNESLQKSPWVSLNWIVSTHCVDCLSLCLLLLSQWTSSSSLHSCCPGLPVWRSSHWRPVDSNCEFVCDCVQIYKCSKAGRCCVPEYHTGEEKDILNAQSVACNGHLSSRQFAFVVFGLAWLKSVQSVVISGPRVMQICFMILNTT